MNRPSFDDPAGELCAITFSERDIRDAARLLGRIKAAELSLRPGNFTGERPGQSHPDPHQQELIRRAQDALSERRRRHKIFGSAMFGEPAWDMMLILYIGQHYQRQNIGRLADIAGVAATTALRWLDYLEQHQLLEREPNPTDARSMFVRLSEKGREALDTYFSETVATG
jgi:hypothetical protein